MKWSLSSNCSKTVRVMSMMSKNASREDWTRTSMGLRIRRISARKPSSCKWWKSTRMVWICACWMTWHRNLKSHSFPLRSKTSTWCQAKKKSIQKNCVISRSRHMIFKKIKDYSKCAKLITSIIGKNGSVSNKINCPHCNRDRTWIYNWSKHRCRLITTTTNLSKSNL